MRYLLFAIIFDIAVFIVTVCLFITIKKNKTIDKLIGLLAFSILSVWLLFDSLIPIVKDLVDQKTIIITGVYKEVRKFSGIIIETDEEVLSFSKVPIMFNDFSWKKGEMCEIEYYVNSKIICSATLVEE